MGNCWPNWVFSPVATDLPDGAHVPVMLAPVLARLAPRDGGRYLDLTFGRGGYARALLGQFQGGVLLACDRDPSAIAAAQALAEDDPRLQRLHANFGELAGHPEIAPESFDGIVADLGVSSPQLDEAERGFSFLRDGPLDMRMDTSRGESAAQWLARVEPGELIGALRRYGEEPQARRIALAILRGREAEPITRTAQLANIIANAVGGRRGKRTHPATRSFQAIRMAVNGELEALAALLEQVHGWLKPGGRLVVVSFHSLEDRAVKRMLQQGARPRAAHPALPDPQPLWAQIGRELCSELEAQRNPRARSAVLRWGCKWPGEG